MSVDAEPQAFPRDRNVRWRDELARVIDYYLDPKTPSLSYHVAPSENARRLIAAVWDQRVDEQERELVLQALRNFQLRFPDGGPWEGAVYVAYYRLIGLDPSSVSVAASSYAQFERGVSHLEAERLRDTVHDKLCAGCPLTIEEKEAALKGLHRELERRRAGEMILNQEGDLVQMIDALASYPALTPLTQPGQEPPAVSTAGALDIER